MEDRTLTLTTDNGEEIVCDILFTYYSEEFAKNYVVFQVRGSDEASAATYDETDGSEGKLGKIETEEEWELLSELLEDYCNNMDRSGCGGSCGGCSGCGSDECDCEGTCDCE